MRKKTHPTFPQLRLNINETVLKKTMRWTVRISGIFLFFLTFIYGYFIYNYAGLYFDKPIRIVGSSNTIARLMIFLVLSILLIRAGQSFKNKKLQLLTFGYYGLHVLIAVLGINFFLFFGRNFILNTVFSQGPSVSTFQCFDRATVDANTYCTNGANMCLYILSGVVYEKDTCSSPHQQSAMALHGVNGCGNDVTAIINTENDHGTSRAINTQFDTGLKDGNGNPIMITIPVPRTIWASLDTPVTYFRGIINGEVNTSICPALAPTSTPVPPTSTPTRTPTPTATRTPTPTPGITLGSVVINVPNINTSIGKTTNLSALAYDTLNRPIWNGVTYEWGISSTGSLGRITPTNTNVVSFFATGAGTGDLFVNAHYSTQSVTKSIAVTVVLPSPTPTPKISGDIDSNPGVTLSDLSTLLANFGKAVTNNPADINHNGTVDLADLSTLLSNFGKY